MMMYENELESKYNEQRQLYSDQINNYINNKKWIYNIINENSLKKDIYEKILNVKELSLSILSTNKPDKSRVTETISKTFMSIINIFTTRSDFKPETWIYNDGIYIPEGITYIKEFVKLILDGAYTTNLCNQVIDKIQVETYINEDDFFINEDLNLIPLKNGIYNLQTNELIDFSPKYRFFNKINSFYDPFCECPNIIKHFETVLQDKSDITVMQELFGYLLFRDYKIQKAIMFSGSGSNGKGITIELMKLFINPANAVNLSLTQLEKDNFCVAALYGKLANLCDDLSKTSLKETGMFKQLTGKGMVSGDRKFKNRISFVNFAKMIFSANELPITNDMTEAFFRRWVIIDFKFQFKPQKEFKLLSHDDRINIKLADPGIIEKITTNTELSGLFNWALIGLKRLLISNSFSSSKSTNETRINWLRKSSSINGFMLDCIAEDYDSYISKEMFKQEYTKYCRKHKIMTEPDHIIKRALETQHGCSDTVKIIETMNKRVWVGIMLKPGMFLHEHKKVEQKLIINKEEIE